MARGSGLSKASTREDRLLRKRAEEMGFSVEIEHRDASYVFSLGDRVLWLGGEGWIARSKDQRGDFVGAVRIYGWGHDGLLKGLNGEAHKPVT